MKYNEGQSDKTMWIIGIVLTLLVFVGIFIAGKGGANPGQSKPGDKPGQLQVSETLHDFGTISMANGKVDYTFKITNKTDKDIDIKTLTTSCMCTNAYIENAGVEKGPFGMPGMGYVPPANELVKAGESRDIKVVYDPAAHGPAGVGAIDRFIYLTDDAGGTNQLEIKANVTP